MEGDNILLGDSSKLQGKRKIEQSVKNRHFRKLFQPQPDPKAETNSLHSEVPDPVKGTPSIPKDKIQKYDRGEKATRFLKNAKKRKRNEKTLEKAKEAAARAELLLQESAGYLEKKGDKEDSDDETNLVSQEDIRRAVDITSAQKIFDLKLDKLGPYRLKFTWNGRFLLLGGSMGHLSGFDWQTKRLQCEFSVNETVHDVAWLHNETMFAVAQKAYTCIYDNKGTELHCLRRIDHAVRLEFLPYHFLLAAGNSKGYLKYLDTSVGKFVSGMQTGGGCLNVMTQNPKSGVIMLGNPQGTVTFWSPSSQKALASVLTNRCAVRSLASTSCGTYIATGSVDRTVSIWDIRMMKELQSYRTSTVPSHLAFSQRNQLAVSLGLVLDVYPNNAIQERVTSPYMTQRLPSPISGLEFCPYEDVLGVTHRTGYSSLIIPGSGEPNFDALENNPYQSTKMRQEAEVKALLEKVPAEMITFQPDRILDVDVPEMKRKLAERKKVNYVKVPDLDFTPRHKKKGRSGTGKKMRRVQMVKSNHKRLLVKGDALTQKMEDLKKKKKGQKKAPKTEKEKKETTVTSITKPDSAYALQRFAPKPNN